MGKVTIQLNIRKSMKEVCCTHIILVLGDIMNVIDLTVSVS